MWRRREGAQEVEKEAQASFHGDISVDRWLFLLLCSLLLTEHTYTAGKQRLMIIVYEIQSFFVFFNSGTFSRFITLNGSD